MNNKVRSALVLVAMMLCTVEAQAVTSFGATDCGKWISQPNAVYKAWLLGYLSGLNSMWDRSPADPLDALSSVEQAWVWMDNYCKKNPLERVSTGAQELFSELVKRKRESQ